MSGAAAAVVPNSVPLDTRSALQQLLAAHQLPRTITPYEFGLLATFYQARDFQPVWSGDETANARAAHVRDVLEHAEDQGLRNIDYATGFAKWSGPPRQGADAAKFDVAVTAALLRYASNVRMGRTKPREVYKDVELPALNYDVVSALSRALSRDALDMFLADLPPPDESYRILVDALSRYREIAAHGGWPVVPASGGKVLAGRLAWENPALAANPEPTDDDISQAITRYETRNGLKVDGKAGPDVIASLNVPAAWRVKQIIANLERRRWLPRALEGRYIVVNIPDQSLEYVADGKVLLNSRVIIGNKATPSPILRTTAKAIVANPPWDIPDSIAAKWLPRLRKNANYLAKRDFVLADGPADDPHGANVNWRRVSANNMPYQIQQPPGPNNVLGALMFDMPNDFDVYLHDTSDKNLFQADTREVSHGCIRVEQIFPLASLALSGDAEDGLEKLTDAVKTGQTQRFDLDDPLTVYLLYWTAIAQPDGTVGFRDDLYGRDKRLAGLLASDGGAARQAPAARAVSLLSTKAGERLAAKRD